MLFRYKLLINLPRPRTLQLGGQVRCAAHAAESDWYCKPTGGTMLYVNVPPPAGGLSDSHQLLASGLNSAAVTPVPQLQTVSCRPALTRPRGRREQRGSRSPARGRALDTTGTEPPRRGSQLAPRSLERNFKIWQPLSTHLCMAWRPQRPRVLGPRTRAAFAKFRIRAGCWCRGEI